VKIIGDFKITEYFKEGDSLNAHLTINKDNNGASISFPLNHKYSYTKIRARVDDSPISSIINLKNKHNPLTPTNINQNSSLNELSSNKDHNALVDSRFSSALVDKTDGRKEYLMEDIYKKDANNNILRGKTNITEYDHGVSQENSHYIEHDIIDNGDGEKIVSTLHLKEVNANFVDLRHEISKKRFLLWTTEYDNQYYQPGEKRNETLDYTVESTVKIQSNTDGSKYETISDLDVENFNDFGFKNPKSEASLYHKIQLDSKLTDHKNGNSVTNESIEYGYGNFKAVENKFHNEGDRKFIYSNFRQGCVIDLIT
jgi:hypothetical protein